ncbi:MAG: hypothetical protein ABI758_03025 [Candidatus Woesebacteria bacterium]
MSGERNVPPENFPANELATYILEVQSLPQPIKIKKGEQLSETKSRTQNHIGILIELSIVLDTVVDLLDTKRLLFTQEQIEEFKTVVDIKLNEIPKSNETNHPRTKVERNIRKLNSLVEFLDIGEATDSFFGAQADRITEERFLEITDSLKNRVLNEGHKELHKRGETKSFAALQQIVNHIGWVRSLLSAGNLRVTSNQIDLFEKELRGWINELEGISEEKIRQHAVDEQSVNKLIADLRSAKKRE